MKNVKRVFAFILVAALMLGLSATAMAASLKIDDPSADTTYTAYQIFKGEHDGTTLANVTWGADVDGAMLAAGLKHCGIPAVEGLLAEVENPTAAQVAAAIGLVNSDNNPYSRSDADKIAEVIKSALRGGAAGTQLEYNENSHIKDDLATGYYFVEEKGPASGYASVSKYMLLVAGNTEINPKKDLPTLDKKVKEDSTGEWGESATYEIGQEIPYQIVGTLPADYGNYKTYFYRFRDTMCKGLKLDESTVKVFAVASNGIDRTDITDNATITVNGDAANGTDLTVTFDNLKQVANITTQTKIVVEYSAYLTFDAEIGLPGNPNEVYLEFSNNPNSDGNGERGETPKEYAIVFTFDVDIVKLDSATEAPLPGAGFKLKRASDGCYYNGLDGDGKVMWVSDAASAKEYLVNDADGKLLFKGLDANENYLLVETKVPAGYNAISDISIIIKTNSIDYKTAYDGHNAETILNQVWLESDVTATAEQKSDQAVTGTVAMTVLNSSASVLPSTGGIGTTIFYVLGTVLVLAAGIILITRRRVNHD